MCNFRAISWWALNKTSITQTDLSLLERMGDSRYRTQAWTDFLDRYTRLFFAWFRRWGVDPHTMEDVLQETMIRVLADLKHFEHHKQGSFRAWLRTLAQHSWSQLFKDAERQLAQRGNNTTQAGNWHGLASKAAENHLLDLFNAMATRELLAMAHARVRHRVDEETWKTYNLVAIEHKSVDEVLQSLKITHTQLYNRLFRVRRMLKEELEELDRLSP